MRVGFFVDTFNQFTPLQHKYDAVSWNTGNILFFEAIKKMIDCEAIQSWEDEKLSDYDAFITTDLIWIQEATLPSERLVHRIAASGSKPIIPISVGLQAAERSIDFQLQPQMVRVLKELESRCLLAVRGEFTAEVLARYSITNVQVIGCPSLYQLPLYLPDLRSLLAGSEASFSSGNYRSFDGQPSNHDIDFVTYIVRSCGGFAEQTLLPLTSDFMPDPDIRDWFERYTYLFFDLETWVRYNKRYDYSFGLRFHGNVAALLAGCPALFVTFDSRTEEMTDFFKLPSITLSKFSTKVPLQVHAENTDYSPFAKSYGNRLRDFESFLSKNQLSKAPAYAQALYSFFLDRHAGLPKEAIWG